LAATAAISQAVNIPTMAASGISSVTAPLAIAAGASGVGVGSAVNKLNSDIAMLQDGFARVL
jgi:thiamine monophosphate synthase